MASVPPNAYRPAFIATPAGWRAVQPSQPDTANTPNEFHAAVSSRALAGRKTPATVATLSSSAWSVAPLLPHLYKNASASLQATAGARFHGSPRPDASTGENFLEVTTWPASIAFVAGASGWLVGGIYTSLVDGTLAWLLERRLH